MMIIEICMDLSLFIDCVIKVFVEKFFNVWFDLEMLKKFMLLGLDMFLFLVKVDVCEGGCFDLIM